MADLEKNLEQAIEEAMQPDSKAEKGDSKAVKQGSSDAASIESGKGEVVKPEENPVDKASWEFVFNHLLSFAPIQTFYIILKHSNWTLNMFNL